MRIICIGYGRLGMQVVRLLDTQKHQVVVIDKERMALERRDRDLHARFLLGSGVDEDLLREAGAAWLEDAKPGLAKGPSGVAVRTPIHFIEHFSP